MRFRKCTSWKMLIGIIVVVSSASSDARAALIYRVSMNTQALLDTPSTPADYALVFTLTDGDGSHNSSVVLSEFNFESGSAIGSPILTGSASGDLTSEVVLTDNGFYNEFVQPFLAGSSLSFLLSLETTNPGLSLDAFSFSILDGEGLPIPTLEPLVGQSFLIAELPAPGGQPPAEIRTYGSDTENTPLHIAAPTLLDPNTPAVPEPSTILSTALGVALVGLSRARYLRRLLNLK